MRKSTSALLTLTGALLFGASAASAAPQVHTVQLPPIPDAYAPHTLTLACNTQTLQAQSSGAAKSSSSLPPIRDAYAPHRMMRLNPFARQSIEAKAYRALQPRPAQALNSFATGANAC